MVRIAKMLLMVTSLAAASTQVQGSKLVDVRTMDREHILIHLLDGEVEYRDDGTGDGALMGHETHGGEVIHTYGALDPNAAADTANFVVGSTGDSSYAAGLKPEKVFRRSKVSGTDSKWPEPNFTIEHVLFLRLPKPMEEGQTYTITFAPAVGASAKSAEVTFGGSQSVSEALHVNLIGYHPDGPKSADLYLWLGDGGARDYSGFVGQTVYVVDSQTGKKTPAGKVQFWKKGGKELGGHDYTKSDVWTADFSDFKGTGTFRLYVEGIGLSPEFRIANDAYFEPYRFSVRGFYYMRIGEPKDPKIVPTPRQPRFIPDVDPPDFKVYRTTFGPWHPDWQKLRGDVWDRKEEWAKYKEPGDPTNPNAYGGHSDACDWDRHAGHVSIIYDMLLPYYLSLGKLDEDNLGIRESGNGVPDLIDEALNEIDFWLRLRDGKGGYSFGTNNPPKEHNVMYQAGARPYMAWVNALNCAMVADCFRLAGNESMKQKYLDEAVKAWDFANGEDLDFQYGIGNGATRGRDYKMMAGAFLYNLTGDRKYEDAMAEEAVIKNATTPADKRGEYCQYWGVAAYLMCAKEKWQPIHHPELLANMKASIAHEAMQKNLDPMDDRPSRRASDEAYGWFQSTQMLHPTVITHAITDDPAIKARCLKAMVLESDWGLGRNPMNATQMTMLGSRHPSRIYTTGRNDGTPGVHPGHTPYMNVGAWGKGHMADPKWYAERGYPAWSQWPHGEGLWEAQYCYSNNEFTPQQTMRGKMLVLGYLWALAKT